MQMIKKNEYAKYAEYAKTNAMKYTTASIFPTAGVNKIRYFFILMHFDG